MTARPWSSSIAVRTALLLTAVVVVGGVPMLVDHQAYESLYVPNVYDHDWARLLRVMGFLPTWWVAALALYLHERESEPAHARRRAWSLALAPAVAGIGAEILKLLLRRERPEANAGHYVFRQWSDQPWSTAGLALPSSHAMVAFGAATALARLFPRAKWVWFVLAAGCGLTRVLARAHFVSDVTLGALMGWSAGWGVCLLFSQPSAPTRRGS